MIRNLSFDDVNSAVLAQSEACMRLLLLAAHAKWSCLPQLAFDALSNVAVEVPMLLKFIFLFMSVLIYFYFFRSV